MILNQNNEFFNTFLCFLMLLFIVKRLGVSCRRGGDGVDPLGGALLEFGQVAGSAFDFTDPAGGHGQRLADLLLRGPVARAQAS